MSVPGAALVAGDLELRRGMWRSWPFFRSLIGTLTMALSKADSAWASATCGWSTPDCAERF